jgi:dTDP-4-amino-4,6-dideoxygalactose transaminase
MPEALAINSGRPVISQPFSGWPIWGEPEKQAVQAAIESGVWGVGGACLEEFSNRFAEFQHVGHVLPVANGTVWGSSRYWSMWIATLSI